METDLSKSDGGQPAFPGAGGSAPSDYETKLAAWKARMRVPDGAPDADAIMIAEDATRDGVDWCVGCGDPFNIRDMRLITRLTDPHMQMDSEHDEPLPEEDRVRMCKPCFAREYESDDCDEPSESNKTAQTRSP